MKLPRNNRDLDAIFKTAGLPEVSDFRGEYFVDMLTGFPSLRKFSHRKVFCPEGDSVAGHNVFFLNSRWGNFFLEKGVCPELGSLEVVVINYQKAGNSFVSHNIIDYVRCLQERTLYLARFNYRLMRKPFFFGYFLLIKIDAQG